MNLKISADEQHSDISTKYAAFVGANSFAPHSFSVRINSHLQPHPLRFSE